MNFYQILMLLLISTFYLTYITKQIMLKRRGIDGTRLAKGNKPGRTFLIEVFLLVGTYGMAAVQYISILMEAKLGLLFPQDVIRMIGVATAFFGVCFFVSAVMVMKDSWRAGVEEGQSTRIVTAGVYRISRNPAFVGFDLIYLGTALSFSNFAAIFGAMFLIVLFHLQILEEEKLLPGNFGQEYLDYCKRTRRYL
jgi:protein-S-isoprenylcysteine O-methyltransferase Ste14